MGTGETRALLSAPRGSRSSSHCPPPSALQGCPHAPPPPSSAPRPTYWLPPLRQTQHHRGAFQVLPRVLMQPLHATAAPRCADTITPSLCRSSPRLAGPRLSWCPGLSLRAHSSRATASPPPPPRSSRPHPAPSTGEFQRPVWGEDGAGGCWGAAVGRRAQGAA